jgi:crotonobetainyl-CoA:carnitine CoA-transferase CaiB-like acyl-CoA transferase
MSGEPAPTRRGAPFLGEHTREVLRESGLTDSEITALERAGVVRAAG